ncbi:hypothetical protein [uncultured Dialister sp.]|jgi:hypothetical protein|uniref:hypothetical protein n=1 Tax=uncultured Dialister sp. TaxID=278064 RepID=UPI0025F20DB9|nr:hypothetical protein [uncultured Dialister sp.]
MVFISRSEIIKLIAHQGDTTPFEPFEPSEAFEPFVLSDCDIMKRALIHWPDDTGESVFLSGKEFKKWLGMKEWT